ncbi:TonB-dependent receptor [Telluribacter sp.]|jgi:hemoglobin/transferrin/lactoferrin receptor protein|uniref:TonB-dependent receptor plug domain-containing protein n=1 Tax=Telluribacter sp. TaxID=1978767 RepID=UPI002E10E2F5|nr:TonB-dependent receptor [Telluribacter sp.]
MYIKLLFFGILLSGTVPVLAQTLEKDTLQLNELQVTAGRFTEQSRLLPFRIKQITARDLAFRNSQTSADVLLQSGDVFIQKSQAGGGSPVLRGFEANRVLLVVDGVRMNNAIYRGGHLQNILRIDNNALEKVEVLFGPASVLYGSDALGGVISFQTRQPTLSDDGRLRLSTSLLTRFSSANKETTQHGTINLGFKNFGSFTSFTASEFGDIRQGKNRLSRYPDFGKRTFFVVRENEQDVVKENPKPDVQVGTAYRQFDMLQKFLYRPTGQVEHVVNIQYSSTGDVPRYDRLTQRSNNGLPSFAAWYYGPEKRFLASYQLKLAGQNFYDKLVLTAAYQGIQESRHSRRFNNSNLRSQVENVEVFSLNADARKVIKAHTWRYGLELVSNQVLSTATSRHILTGATVPSDTRYPDGGSTMNWLGAYLTDQWAVAEAVVLNAGLRYSLVRLEARFNSKEFFPFPFNQTSQQAGNLSGNIGVVYLPAPATRLNLHGSTGFRSPNVDDLGKVFDSQPGLVVVPNPGLRPEYTYNLEVTANQRLGEYLWLDATAYQTWLRDAIVMDAFTFSNQSEILYDGVLSRVRANQNKQRALVRGYHLGFNARLRENLSLRSTYNYTSGRVLEANGTTSPLDHIPPRFGKTSLQYEIPKFRAELSTLYNGWKHLKDYRLNAEDNEAFATPDGTPAWWTLDLRTSYQANQYLTLQLACENILDRNYRYFASGVSAPGRNFIFSLRGSF